MTHNERLDSIENLIDEVGVAPFARLVAEVLSAKADYCEANYRNGTGAEAYNRASAIFIGAEYNVTQLDPIGFTCPSSPFLSNRNLTEAVANAITEERLESAKKLVHAISLPQPFRFVVSERTSIDEPFRLRVTLFKGDKEIETLYAEHPDGLEKSARTLVKYYANG